MNYPKNDKCRPKGRHSSYLSDGMMGKEMLPRLLRIFIIHPELHGFPISKNDANDHCTVRTGISANGIPNFLITVYLTSKTHNGVCNSIGIKTELPGHSIPYQGESDQKSRSKAEKHHSHGNSSNNRSDHWHQYRANTHNQCEYTMTPLLLHNNRLHVIPPFRNHNTKRAKRKAPAFAGACVGITYFHGPSPGNYRRRK